MTQQRPVSSMTECAVFTNTTGKDAAQAISPGSRFIRLRGGIVYLNPMEYALLAAFLRHPGVVLSRDQLMREVWRTDFLGASRTVDVHVASLRKKLGWRSRIKSVRKVGYALVAGPGAGNGGKGDF